MAVKATKDKAEFVVVAIDEAGRLFHAAVVRIRKGSTKGAGGGAKSAGKVGSHA